MRLSGLVVGTCLLFNASIAAAAPPLDLSETSLRRDASRSGTPFHMPHRAPGVDAAEKVHAGTSGTYKAVVILLQFPDERADTLNHTPADFADLLFSVGTHPNGSFRDYYREISRGQFDVDGIVTRWYMAPHPYSFYVNGQSGFGSFPQNSQGMVADAVALADPDVDFSQFDNNGPDGIPNSGDDDGVIDGLFIVHAGPGGEETGSVNDMWSHKFNLPGGIPADGIRAFAYSTEPEEWGKTTSLTTAGDLISIGVFCHEFGHVLGLPDLYDLTDSPTASEGVGEWDLMSTGVYTHKPGNPPGSTPAHMSAWSKIRLGWVTPTWVLQDSAGVTILPVETSGQVFRLWTNGEDTGEYFLAENRQPLGFDAGLVRSSIEAGDGPAHGLLIYHVDESILNNNNYSHKMLDVEEAGGPEVGSGTYGAQNLDVHSGTISAQLTCGLIRNVTGNRGDKYDPWPGPENATSFDGSCPPSAGYCANSPSQVAIRSMVESAGNVAADLFVNGITVRHLAPAVDDSPFGGHPNNGNGLAEPGETVRLRIPLVNTATHPTGPLTAILQSEPFFTFNPTFTSYASIPAGATDSGTVVQATISASSDPRGVGIRYWLTGSVGIVDVDSTQVLVGVKKGICDDFEGTLRRWVSTSGGCSGINEWHREAGVNHTTGGTWAWRLGPPGVIGSYSPSQDARLLSQPIRLDGIADTLTFWQRYDSEFAVDGLTVEISNDGGDTWSVLVPVGGYSNGDRWTGFQPTFVQASVPLPTQAGIVQIGFRFRSSQFNGGLGWWVDDVNVTGDDACGTTDVAVTRFDAVAVPGRAAVQIAWKLADAVGATVGIDRAFGAEPRRRIVTLPVVENAGEYEDADVLPGLTYSYWLLATHPGQLDAVAGPVLVPVPAGAYGAAPSRALAIDRVRPNPFTPNATFSVSLDRDGPYVVRVFRADGSLVRTLADSRGQQGVLPFTWDGTDDRGKPVGAGLYFFELRAQGRSRVQKAILLR